MFRIGTKCKLNVYEGDKPCFQAHSEEDAAGLVELLNLGLVEMRRIPVNCEITGSRCGSECWQKEPACACRTCRKYSAMGGGNG